MPDFRLSVSTLELLKRKIFVKSKIHTLSLYSDILRKIHLKSLKVKVSRVCKIFHENYKFGHFDHFLFFFFFFVSSGSFSVELVHFENLRIFQKFSADKRSWFTYFEKVLVSLRSFEIYKPNS